MTEDRNTNSQILAAIMGAAVDAIIVFEMDGTILRANASAGALFGFRPNELIGKDVRAVMPDATHAQAQPEPVAAGTLQPKGKQETGRRKDGTTFPLHVSVGEARIDGIHLNVAIMHDLTQRLAGNAALARSQRLDAIGQMTGGITHDFNNLLTVIIGNLELLEPRVKDGRGRELLAQAIDSAEIAADLTSRLMLFARKGTLDPELTDLKAVCDQMIGMLRRTMGPRTVVSTHFEEGAALVHIDRVQLQSAILNLALNARDAMPLGGSILLSVEHITIDDDFMAEEAFVEQGDYVRLMVSDNGEGMSPEVRDKVFEPFFTTKPESQGTGLGLASVYGFVRQSGGYITVYSEPGLGTSFNMYFPAAKVSARDAKMPGDANAPFAGNGRGQLVLVVEDNERVRRITVERLMALGYQTVTAESGDEAWRLLKDGLHPALVFTDLVMPGRVNGFELAARIGEEFPKLPVLLTSGYASDVLTTRMPSFERREILHKPYHQRDLAERLQSLLGDADADITSTSQVRT